MDVSAMKKFVDGYKDIFEDAANRIWDNPELSYEEFKSTKIQQDTMSSLGFEVTAGIGGIETAFVASWGSGHPVVAILGEFDALPGLSQKADETVHDPVLEGAPGHGCGHNILGTAAMRGAASVKAWMEQEHIPGTIRYYGCPAEEGGAGKAFMVREGCFDGVDACFSWHPAGENMMTGPTLASIAANVSFTGTPAHAAATPQMGRSALDAAELMNVGVQFLREHVTDDVRIHYAFTDAGGAYPNVVQSHAAIEYQVRATTLPRAMEVYKRVENIAKGAALMTDTTVDMGITKAYANVIPNPTLYKIVEKNLELALPVDYTAEDRAYAQRFFDLVGEDRRRQMEERAKEAGAKLSPVADFISKPLTGVLPASSDAGDVSWVVPSVGFNAATCAVGTAEHSWMLVAQGKSQLAYKGMAGAALVFALSAADVFENPEIVKDAKADLEATLGGVPYKSVIPDDVKPGK